MDENDLDCNEVACVSLTSVLFPVSSRLTFPPLLVFLPVGGREGVLLLRINFSEKVEEDCTVIIPWVFSIMIGCVIRMRHVHTCWRSICLMHNIVCSISAGTFLNNSVVYIAILLQVKSKRKTTSPIHLWKPKAC